jgi:AraC-like DNA-binding protein
MDGLVVEFGEYHERAQRPVTRREVAGPEVIVAIELEEPLLVAGGGGDGPAQPFTCFAAGVAGGATRTFHHGRQHCVEVRLTPLGAYRLFGIPMRELTGKVVDLPALWPRAGAELAERLAEADGWEARFAVLDHAVGRALDAGPEPDPVVEQVWRTLVERQGNVATGELADEAGWSRGRLAQRFGAQVGTTPKAAARLLRFRRAVELLNGPERRCLASVAVSCGYYDQAHLNRDFRALAGCPPTRWLGAKLPDLPGTGWDLA